MNTLPTKSSSVPLEEDAIEDIESIELEDIEGLGRVTAEKLRNAGIYSIKDLATSSVMEIGNIIGSEHRAKMLILNAQKLLSRGRFFITAKEYYEERQKINQISTGCKSLDELLEGGIETKAITELIGEFGAGKTQLCHQLCVMVQLPPEEGGLSGKAIYIDTEGTFRPERIIQIAEYRGLDPREALRNIVYARAYNFSVQVNIPNMVYDFITANRDVRLVVVDDIAALYRLDIAKEPLLILHELAGFMKNMSRIAKELNIAVVIANQVTEVPGEGTKPLGAHYVEAFVTDRIFLRRVRDNVRSATLEFSRRGLERKKVLFEIAEHGIS